MKAFIFVPASAPEAKVAQLLVYGAKVFLVEGPYEDAFRVCQAAVEEFGWYNRNCAINPYLVEGKKTCGLIAQLRLYQPNSSTAAWQTRNASSYGPSTRKTFAPYTRSWATFASGAEAGTKMKAFIPASAAKPASDEAALPVEEHVISFRPSHRARRTTTELARSLNEAVGFRPSSLTRSAPRPSS